MGSSRNYQRYASAWMTLFEAFNEDPYKQITIECPNDKAAQAMRLEFYRARAAFLEDESMKDIYGAVLDSREVTVHGHNVTFDSKDRSWMNEAINQAIGHQD